MKTNIRIHQLSRKSYRATAYINYLYKKPTSTKIKAKATTAAGAYLKVLALLKENNS